MPRKAIDYTNTHFYKIVCKDLSIADCYVGHTTDFIKRKYSHRQACINPNVRFHNLDSYKTIRENCSWDNWDMVLIRTENIANSLEARKREREYIEELKANLNMVKAYRSKAEADEVGREFREIHKEEKREYDKIYREANKEKSERTTRYIVKTIEINYSLKLNALVEIHMFIKTSQDTRSAKNTKNTSSHQQKINNNIFIILLIRKQNNCKLG